MTTPTTPRKNTPVPYGDSITPYTDAELGTRARDVRPRLHEDLLHKLAADPTFELRDTIPCPPPFPEADSAPPSPAVDWNDGWL